MADAAAASSSSSSSVPSSLKPTAAMMAVQSVLAGVNIFYKLAVSDGMAPSILTAYRCLLGTAVLCPVAYFLERKKRPPMTRMVLVHAFFSGLFGCVLVQNLYVSGIKLTSVTFATAINNLVPVLTFLLAMAFRMEKVRLGTAAGHLKVGGTALAVGGAMVLTFYKGSELHLWPPAVNLLDSYKASGRTTAQGSPFIGSLICVGSCLSYSLWLILQAKMGPRYPCPYSSTALMSAMGGAQAVVYALYAERGNWRVWRMGFDIRLLTVVYNGVVASAIGVTVLAWVVSKKGPLYVSVFSPLILVIVAVLGSLLLGETLHIGSVLGSALIIAGLYFVLWGKRREAGAAKVVDQEELPTTTTTAEVTKGGASRIGSSRHSSVLGDSIHLGIADSMLQLRFEEEIAAAVGAVAAADEGKEMEQRRWDSNEIEVAARPKSKQTTLVDLQI